VLRLLQGGMHHRGDIRRCNQCANDEDRRTRI